MRYLVLLMIFGLVGCADTYQSYGRHSIWTPAPMFIRGLPQGDDSYSIGVRDGCNTAVGLIGSAMLRNHEFSYDVQRGIEDQEYYEGFRAGQTYCVYYTDRGPL